MLIAASTLSLFAIFALAAPPQETAAKADPFPASSALAEEVGPDSLAKLSQLVQSFVDDEEIVGAELLVIKNGRSILHEAYGMGNREAEVPMETGSVFCVRSMTKPVIAASILMLVDDRLLKLNDTVAQYLPSFDVEGSRDITVEHLLTHTSGLPMSLIMATNLLEVDGIQAVADLGGGHELHFEPGSDISYSDQGTDTLTALIEVVTGKPAADFVRTRVLEPLGMQDSACVMTEGHTLRPRALPKYAGTSGNWTRFWNPDEPPLFPFFLGSQGLYSTLEDYARFMKFWQRKGRPGKDRLLRARYARKALKPGPYALGAPTGFPGLTCHYGYLMQLWTSSDEEGKSEVVVFGHTGSDGTYAWVFPEQKAMVLYFTQSRNNTTGLRVEEALGELFLGVPYDPNQAAPPFEEYLGYYWENDIDDLYRAIIRDGDDMALEIMGKGVVPLSYIGDDRWKFRPNPSIVLQFDRSETGEVTGYHIGDHQEFRFEPPADLPSVDEVVTLVTETHRIDLLESLGPMMMSAELSIEKLDITGEVSTLLAWPDRFRVDTAAGDNFERLAFDGEQVLYESSTKALAPLEGTRAAQVRLDNPVVRLGDWDLWYPTLQVIQQLVRGGRRVTLVRTGDTSAPATTLFVDMETGHVLRETSMTYIDGMGRIGQRLTFGDFREVSGMLLPFRTEVKIANPLIGSIVVEVTEVELGVDPPAGTFELQQ